MKKAGRIENFLEDDFGIGGLSNYSDEQIKSAWRVMKELFSGDFACAEIGSIAEFLTSLNTDNESAPLQECINELDELGIAERF